MAVPESMSDPVARLEQRARECEHLLAAYRSRDGPVPLDRIERLDAKMWAYREAARDIRDALEEPAGLTLTLRPERGVARKFDIDYSGRGHTLVEREWTGCKWRYVGDERLQGVALDVERFEDA